MGGMEERISRRKERYIKIKINILVDELLIGQLSVTNDSLSCDWAMGFE